MKVGTICKLKVDCPRNKAGTLGVVFSDYGDGFQVIFEDGRYDGFLRISEKAADAILDGKTEEDYYLEEVGFEASLGDYQFKNVMHVTADYKVGTFDIAWSEKWKMIATCITSVAPTPIDADQEQSCRICGCTDSKACDGGCSWVMPGICSKCITGTVPECIDLLIDTILLTHQDEINHEHHGDANCSTCDLIGMARKIEEALW